MNKLIRNLTVSIYNLILECIHLFFCLVVQLVNYYYCTNSFNNYLRLTFNNNYKNNNSNMDIESIIYLLLNFYYLHVIHCYYLTVYCLNIIIFSLVTY